MLKIRDFRKNNSNIVSEPIPLAEGNAPRSNFIAQVLSGYADPREYSDKPALKYKSSDYKAIAASIYHKSFKLPPDLLFQDITSGYGELNNDFDRQIYLNDLKLFIGNLIKGEHPNTMLNKAATEVKAYIGAKIHQSDAMKNASEDKLKKLKERN